MEKLKQAYEKKNKKLNKTEKMKQERNALEAIEKIKEYAENGYDSIPEEDKKYFLKCFGIYDRPKTPGLFMIKLRIPGGQLNSRQARVIGEISKKFGRDYMDLTTRAQIELRYIRIEDIPEILERLNSVGITSFQTGVDNIRGIVNDPLDGVAMDNILSSQNLLLEMQKIFLKNPEWIDKVPRKFNTALNGSFANRSNIFTHDLAFVLAMKDGVYGFNVYLGGRVGNIAKPADIFVKPDEVVACFEATAKLFREFGFRDNRNKNRLQFLIEAVGMNEISKAIREIAGIDFARAGQTLTNLGFYEKEMGKVLQKNGNFVVYANVPSGLFSGSDLIEAARLSEEYGEGRIRLTVEQSLFILDVEKVDKLLKEKFFEKYKNIDSPYKTHLVACAGTKFCPFGVIENKHDAIEMAEYLEKEVSLNKRVVMHWSACPKGCGTHGIANIGFEGCKAKFGGKNVSGVHIYIGGGMEREGYTILRNVPLVLAKLYIKELMIEFKKDKSNSFEEFHNKVLNNFTKEFIGFFLKLKTYLKEKNIEIDLSFEEFRTPKLEEIEIKSLAEKLYFKLTGIRPFGEVKGYKRIKKLNKDVDENLSQMIDLVLEEKAIVFSEIVDLISID